MKVDASKVKGEDLNDLITIYKAGIPPGLLVIKAEFDTVDAKSSSLSV